MLQDGRGSVVRLEGQCCKMGRAVLQDGKGSVVRCKGQCYRVNQGFSNIALTYST